MSRNFYGALLLLLLLCPALTRAQHAGVVTGVDGKPLAHVSATVMEENRFIVATLTNDSGYFKIPRLLVVNHTYCLRLSLVGYENYTQKFTYPDTGFLQNLVLTQKPANLEGVTVTSKQPLITRKADRYIVQVEGSYLANGNSGLDVLQKTPGLWVNANGTIRITGSQSVTVMINDVVQHMSSAELADYLRSMRSENISKIEIIPNPPAEYEASATGGIVHIVLKKAREQGFTGSVFAQYKQQQRNPYSSGGIMADLKTKRLYVTGSVNGTIDRSFYTGLTQVSYPDKSTLDNYGERNNHNTRTQIRLAAEYELSPVQTISLQTTSTANNLLQYFYSDIRYNTASTLLDGSANTDWIRRPRSGSSTLNYNWKIDTFGTTLKIIADYTTSKKEETNTLRSTYNDANKNSLLQTNTPSSTSIYSVQSDFVKPINVKTTWRAGVKGVYTTRSNAVQGERDYGTGWVPNPGLNDLFQYNEKLMMAYGAFEKTIHNTSIKAGLRAEQTFAEGLSVNTGSLISRKYFGLFPSLFVNHVTNSQKGNSLHANYSRRVKRPGYNDLNPYRLQVHDFTVLTGNPNLVPQYTHSIQFGYTHVQKFTADVYVQSTNNFIAQTANTLDSNLVEYKSKNYRNNTEFGLSLSANNSITKNWSSNNSILVYHAQSKLDDVHLRQTTLSLKSVQTITLKKIADVDVIAEYTSAYLLSNARQAGIFYMDLGVTRRMFRNTCRLRFAVTDLFNSLREKEITDFKNTQIYFYQKRPTRTASLSFTYNFKAGKTFAKKRIEQNNTEEKARLGNL